MFQLSLPLNPSKIKDFLLSPFTGNKKWWIRVLLVLAMIIPWLLLGWYYFFGRGMFSDSFNHSIKNTEKIVDSQIKNYEKTDKDLLEKQKELFKKIEDIKTKTGEQDEKFTPIYKDIETALNSSTPIDELDKIRDRLNKI